MTWDDLAQRVAIHALGQVECSMDYGAVNATDPISIGLFQWYGSRAADLLTTIKTSGDWSSPSPTIDASLTAHSSSDTAYWNNRYVTAQEIIDLGTTLRITANVNIQDTLAHTDLETYRQAGEAAGLSADSNTQTMQFFVNMYNQGPVYALRVLNKVGGNATLGQIYSACLNDSVLGIYRSRYSQVYSIIQANDPGTVGSGTSSGTAPPPPGTGSGNVQPTTNLQRIVIQDRSAFVTTKDGHSIPFYPTHLANVFTAGSDPTLGAPVGGTAPPPTGDVTAQQTSVANKFISMIDAYQYGQGPCRLTPDTCGYTDCSGAIRWAYLQAIGYDPGTWGGSQIGNGKLITTSISQALQPGVMEPGDLIFIRWNDPNSPPAYDHTVMYVGPHSGMPADIQGGTGGDILSHGGPGAGPNWRTASSYLPTTAAIMVRRYVGT